jgi:sugar lactone lactonase YvrE
LNAANSILMMNVGGKCYGLFVDTMDNLYCCLSNAGKVEKYSLISGAKTIVAGNGETLSTPYGLSAPHGIYVDINFDLYVADTQNNRIQLFHSGKLSGITVAGRGAPGTIILNYPKDVVLDNDGYLFIVDSYNHRIVGSGLNGFRCLVGCSGSSGAASNQLQHPSHIAFDSYGNIFVTDTGNSRIQKFLLKSNYSI